MIPQKNWDIRQTSPVSEPDLPSGNRFSISAWDYGDTLSLGGDDPQDIVIADVNNDGQNDIITGCAFSDEVSVYLWNTTLKDWDSEILLSVENAMAVAVGDVNNDGANDITAGFGSGNLSIILWNRTTNTWNPAFSKTIGSGASDIIIEDATNSGDNDIVIANSLNKEVSILVWNRSIGAWNPQINLEASNESYSVNNAVVGDANADGQNDIIALDEAHSNLSIFIWNTTLQSWNPQITRTVGAAPAALALGDVNHDGQNDLVTVHPSTDQVAILHGERIDVPSLLRHLGTCNPPFNVARLLILLPFVEEIGK